MASILQSDKRHIISLFHSILTAIIAQPLPRRSRVTCSGWTKTPILSWWLPWLASGHEPLWLCSNTVGEHPSHWMAEKRPWGLQCQQQYLFITLSPGLAVHKHSPYYSPDFSSCRSQENAYSVNAVILIRKQLLGVFCLFGEKYNKIQYKIQNTRKDFISILRSSALEVKVWVVVAV